MGILHFSLLEPRPLFCLHFCSNWLSRHVESVEYLCPHPAPLTAASQSPAILRVDFFLASQKENNPPTFVKELCHVVIILKKVGLNSFSFFFFSPFLVLSVCVTFLVVFHFTKQLVWWINIFFFNLKISLYVANLWLRVSWQSSLSRWSRHWTGFSYFSFL